MAVASRCCFCCGGDEESERAKSTRKVPVEPGLLPFLAVGRVKDNAVLASYIQDLELKEEVMAIFRKVLIAAASKLSGGQRTRLQWNDGSVCCLMDQQGLLLYVVVTTHQDFPERNAYQLLYDLVLEVQSLEHANTAPEDGLTKELEDTMKGLIKKYEELGLRDVHPAKS